MKASELRNLSEEELSQKYKSLKEELYGLRIDVKAGRIEKPHKIKALRRDIARLNTIINERGKTQDEKK